MKISIPLKNSNANFRRANTYTECVWRHEKKIHAVPVRYVKVGDNKPVSEEKIVKKEQKKQEAQAVKKQEESVSKLICYYSILKCILKRERFRCTRILEETTRSPKEEGTTSQEGR